MTAVRVNEATAPQWSDLTIPDIHPAASTLDAAFSYNNAGLYVGPIVVGKNPGSRLGEKWQTKTSRDAGTVVGWFAGSTDGIFIHCGRSGLVVFEVDYPDRVPDWMWPHLDTAPFQQTRPTVDPRRGHYVFAIPPGVMYGNGRGPFYKAMGFGEIRGRNGVIVAAPSSHPKHADGGAYRWARSGPVPYLPEDLAQHLPARDPHRESDDAATDSEVEAFLDSAMSWVADNPTRGRALLDSVITKATTAAAAGSRHESLAEYLAWAMDDAAAGIYPAREAHHRFAEAWQEWWKQKRGPEERTQPDPGEYAGVLAWAVGQATAKTSDQLDERCDRVTADRSGAAWLDDATGVTVEDQVFTATPELEYIRQVARHCMVSPWLVLGAAVTATLAATPPLVRTPGYVGTPASLNTFIAAVGPSSAGKTTAVDVALERVLPAAVREAITVRNPSSGEGIAALFVKVDSKGEQTQLRDRVLSVVDEIATLAAQQGRSGSTLDSYLRSAWSGAALSQNGAELSRQRNLPAHSYRFCMIVGVQPASAHHLTDDHGQGTPQRFLWLPALDPHLPDDDTPEPAVNPFTGWRRTRFNLANILPGDPAAGFPLPDHVGDLVKTNRRERQRGNVDALDGHALLARIKLAIGLAVLHSQDHVDDTLWNVTGHILDVSDATRAGVLAHQKREAEARDAARGISDARRDAVRHRHTVEVAAKTAARAVHRHDTGDGVTRRQIKDAVGKRHRDTLGEALEVALTLGWIRIEQYPHPTGNGATATRYLRGQVTP